MNPVENLTPEGEVTMETKKRKRKNSGEVLKTKTEGTSGPL